MIDLKPPAGIHRRVEAAAKQYGLRPGAEEFPLMVVISIIYPCNFGCPMCPYTDGNSDLRKFYHAHDGDLMPVKLWEKMADECGPYGAWMRCTGGGEPMLHKHMVEMVEYAKAKGVSDEQALNDGMQSMSDTFKKAGSEIYIPISKG